MLGTYFDKNSARVHSIFFLHLPKLSNKEMEMLMQEVKKGDKKAKQKFVYANMRLVLSVAQRFLHKKFDADDLFQVGCVGLIKAIDNFDTSLGVRFSTYAVPMIMGEIRRFLRDNNAVRVSRSLRDIAYKALQSREKLSFSMSREPTVDEIADDIGVGYMDVACALDAISEPMSLSEPIYTDDQDEMELGEHLTDEFDIAEKYINNVSIKDAIKTLSPRERKILLLRYYVGKTQVEVSEEVGISQAQVSRLEKSALSVVKKYVS